jgi:cell wall-associated NlpC family hydrolase
MLVFIIPAIAETASTQKPAQDESAVAVPIKKKVPEPKDKQAEGAGEASSAGKAVPSPNASLASAEILEFNAQPATVQKLLESCLDLAKQNLTYTYGSGDPAKGGLDCSGFIYYVLRQQGFTQVPRDSSGQYVWVRSARGFRSVIGRKIDSFEMDELLPGDLLFWTGTYATSHDPPISHVMIYLGTEKSTGAKVMIGSSDGRTYRDQRRNGVSVFDFKLPKAAGKGDAQSVFVGYGRIPGLRE